MVEARGGWSSPAPRGSSARTSSSGCSPPATRSSASTPSRTTTRGRSRRPTSHGRALAGASRWSRRTCCAWPATRPRAAAASTRSSPAPTASSTSRRRPACAPAGAQSFRIYTDNNVLATQMVLEACRRAGRAQGRLRLVVVGLRRHRPAAHARGRQLPPGLALRRHQARRRAALPPVLEEPRRAYGRPALLHGLRAAPAAGHGLPPVPAGDARGSPAGDVRHRQPDAGLHLRRRHRRAASCCAVDGVDGAVYNLGGGSRVTLLEAIRTLESVSGLKAEVRGEGVQAGDVQAHLGRPHARARGARLRAAGAARRGPAARGRVAALGAISAGQRGDDRPGRPGAGAQRLPRQRRAQPAARAAACSRVPPASSRTAGAGSSSAYTASTRRRESRSARCPPASRRGAVPQAVAGLPREVEPAHAVALAAGP